MLVTSNCLRAIAAILSQLRQVKNTKIQKFAMLGVYFLSKRPKIQKSSFVPFHLSNISPIQKAEQPPLPSSRITFPPIYLPALLTLRQFKKPRTSPQKRHRQYPPSSFFSPNTLPHFHNYANSKSCKHAMTTICKSITQEHDQ